MIDDITDISTDLLVDINYDISTDIIDDSLITSLMTSSNRYDSLLFVFILEDILPGARRLSSA